jgi:hypothetical protein
VPEDLRSAVVTRLLDRLAIDDSRLEVLAGPTSLTAGEIASLRRSAAVRRAFRRYPPLAAMARTAFRVIRGLRGARR